MNFELLVIREEVTTTFCYVISKTDDDERTEVSQRPMMTHAKVDALLQNLENKREVWGSKG